MSQVKILYRELLLAAQHYDRHVSLRAIVTSNMMQSTVSRASKTRLPHAETYNRCLQRFLGKKSFYLPSRSRPTLQQLIREEFRKPQTTQASAVDAAFLAFKALNDTLAEARELGVLPSASTDADAAFQPLPNVQEAEKVTTGIFLLAHPLLSGIFGRKVIILTEHSQQGSRGFIVNEPTPGILMRTFRVSPNITKAFGSCKVYEGGPVNTPNAEILHGRADLGGHRVITTNFPSGDEPSLFVGMDLESAARAVEDQTARPSDIVFFNGVSSWTAGQLDREMARGTWIPVKAPVSLAVNAPKELWRDLMHTLGGEYEEFSRMPAIDDEYDAE